MNKWGAIQDPTRTGRKRIGQDSRRKALTPQKLRTMENILGEAFQLEVYTNKISLLKVEINLFRHSQQRPIA
jgi:hypothetical protein